MLFFSKSLMEGPVFRKDAKVTKKKAGTPCSFIGNISTLPPQNYQ